MYRWMCRLVLFGLAAWPAAMAQSFPAGAVESFVRAEMERQKVPGVSYAVVKGGEVLAARGLGYANVEHRVRVTPETVFQSGSVGKQFTSTAVMLLVEEGKISLDESIARHFPGVPASWKAITPRHLLTHTSGIPDYTPDTIDYRRDYTEEELERLAFGLQLEFPPGSRWNYSNTGYVLLGILIHKVSGKFYGELLQERVFAPLGMKTARVITEADIVPNRAAGYRLQRGELKNQDWVAPKLNTTADGSLYLTLLDMIAWEKGLRNKAVLKPESWAGIFETLRLRSGNPYPYGFGWAIDKLDGQLQHHHGGAWQGFKSYISRWLGDDLTIIVLANLANADPKRFVDGIAEIVNPELAPPELKPMADSDEGIRARLEAVLTATREGKLAPADFAYVRAGFFPDGPRRFQQRLADLGEIKSTALLERKQVGDDRISTYELTGAKGVARVRLGLAPDGKVSIFDIRPRP